MARKIRAKTDNSGWVDPTKKKRKKRKGIHAKTKKPVKKYRGQGR